MDNTAASSNTTSSNTTSSNTTGPAPVIAPKVELENQWFGYTITIESNEQSYLGAN
jgi:hypothetical protein